MDVVLGRARHIEVHHVPQGLDVDAARHDVGRDQHADLPLLEAGERRGALRLGTIAVNLVRLDAGLHQVARESVGAMLGAREDERVVDLAARQEMRQERRLEHLRHRIDRLRDADRGPGRSLEVDRRGLLQHLAAERGDRLRHGRAEEEGLACRRQMLQHLPDLRQEAHVEHAVGLVEHEVLEMRELRVAEAEVIEQTPRRCDDEVGSASKRVLLRPHRRATVDRRAGDRRVHGEVLEVVQNLRRQLARRRQDERARDAARLVDQVMRDRQEERAGLAASGHGAGEEITPFERERNARFLNRRRPNEAELLDSLEQTRMKLERGKRQGDPFVERGEGVRAAAGRSEPSSFAGCAALTQAM